MSQLSRHNVQLSHTKCRRCVSSYRVSTSGSHVVSVAMIFPLQITYCNLWLSRCKLRSQLAATSTIRTSASLRLHSLCLLNLMFLQHPTLSACKLNAAPLQITILTHSSTNVRIFWEFPHLTPTRVCVTIVTCTYRVIQEESAILWEVIVCVILSKKVHVNMGPILNGYRDMVKRRYGPSCEHEQQLRNK